MKKLLPFFSEKGGVIIIKIGYLSCQRSSPASLIMVKLKQEIHFHYLQSTDQFAESTYKMLNFGPAQERDVESLQHWLDGTGCLAREERKYLTHHRELVSLAPAGDSAIVQLEAWVETKFIRLWRDFRKAR